MASIQETTASRICLLYLKLSKTVEKCRGGQNAYGLSLSYIYTAVAGGKSVGNSLPTAFLNGFR